MSRSPGVDGAEQGSSSIHFASWLGIIFNTPGNVRVKYYGFLQYHLGNPVVRVMLVVDKRVEYWKYDGAMKRSEKLRNIRLRGYSSVTAGSSMPFSGIYLTISMYLYNRKAQKNSGHYFKHTIICRQNAGQYKLTVFDK